MIQLLIVDDEPNVASSLALLLQRAGYQTCTAASGQAALALLQTQEFDLALVDINLGDPLLDGLALCREMRSRPAYLPVIMLTARDSATDKVLGLEIGADDYITKPFDERELLARIRATLRTVAAASKGRQAAVLPIDAHMQIDSQRRRVYRNGTEVPLTHREFDLLLYLATNAGRPFGREMLLDQVWGWDFAGDTRTVDKHVAELRRKLEDDPANPRYILTVRGVGYTFREW
ncbi:MAG: response regulator transcription factor [Chloroflexaceae bacterium]|jgi:DNA-binding response OmpR family regulator|nr:response regulator transcription factor [Chloroflexaceae bacterium]